MIVRTMTGVSPLLSARCAVETSYMYIQKHVPYVKYFRLCHQLEPITTSQLSKLCLTNESKINHKAYKWHLY